MKTASDHLSYLMKLKGIWFRSFITFLPDSRLTSPFSVVGQFDAKRAIHAKDIHRVVQ